MMTLPLLRICRFTSRPNATRWVSRRHASIGAGREPVANLRRAAAATALAFLFLIAFSLRAWGARFGLPEYFYHPDEHAIVDRATAILRTGDCNPHWFNYPSTYIYVQALSYIPYFLISAARGFGDTIPSSTPYGFYFTGRLVTALIGALTVTAVYALGRRMFGFRTALLASLLLTVSLLHTVHSHYVTTDVPVAFLITLCLIFCHLAMERASTKHFVLAGLFAGLATSTKYPALIAILPVFVAHLLTVRWGEWSSLAAHLGSSAGAFLAGFLLGTPYAVLDLSTFFNSLAAVVSHYSAAQPGFEGSDSAVWYVAQMLGSADVVIVTLGLIGIAWALFRHTRKDILLLAFLVPYYLLLSVWRVRFERHLVALFPLLVILAARFAVEGTSLLGERLRTMRKGEIPVLACVSALAVFMPTRAIIDFDVALSQKDHRTIAAEWANANLPTGSRVVTEAFSIPLDGNRFQLLGVVRIDSHDLDWYRREGVEYVVVSDGHWRVLFGQPEIYAQEIGRYNELLNHSIMLQDFSPSISSSLARGYPTLLIYHFPEVLILQLE